ncbi:MAG TPA: phosphoribosylamine--glycine ligase [Thermoanaerobaculia bacterium]|nr:phosphoribosylamine--glycine ligase [Thermoanaerobaculia bacterium]
MKVLLVGSGGREHALAAALRAGGSANEIFAAPGNAGIAKIADVVPISADSVIELADFAERVGIGLTVVGPELPLTLGIVDEFQKRDLPIFGPTRLATEIEASKVFSKELCRRLGIPTARAWLCSSRGDAERALAELGFPAVIKADGLAAGKGVMVVATSEEAKGALDLYFDEKVFGNAADRVLVEEFLEGEEASFLALCDGKTALALPTAKDYKKVFDGDRGPNTGGMGAHSPAGVLGGEQAAAVLRDVVHPVLSSMAQDRRAFCGLLYVGLMLTSDGMKVLEFNARFGDPETEAILPRLGSDIAPALAACAAGNLAGCELVWKPEACVAVVLASAGYPGSYQTGFPIEGLEEAESLPGVTVFHAGTKLRDGAVVTAGGRVLVVCGRGANLSEASERAYAAADRIRFEGKSHRRDIGARFLAH